MADDGDFTVEGDVGPIDEDTLAAVVVVETAGVAVGHIQTRVQNTAH